MIGSKVYIYYLFDFFFKFFIKISRSVTTKIKFIFIISFLSYTVLYVRYIFLENLIFLCVGGGIKLDFFSFYSDLYGEFSDPGSGSV